MMRKRLIAIVIVNIVILIIAIAVFTKHHNQYDQDRQAYVVGGLYSTDENAALSVMRLLNDKSYTTEDVEKGLSVAERFGYTRSAFKIAQDSKEDKYSIILAAFLVIQMAAVCLSIFLISKRYYVLQLKNRTQSDRAEILNNKHEVIYKKQQIQQYMENVAHQIKTPLTVILLNMELLKKENTDSIVIDENIEKIEQIKSLLARLMQIGRIESGEKVMKFEKMNLIDSVEIAINNIVDSKITINTQFGESCIYYGDFLWITEAFTSLMENACEDANSCVCVEINSTNTDIRISISGDGENVPEELSQNIFDRYYSTSDDRKTHFGIGLNLAKAVINAHFGSIALINNKNGTEFRIILPLIKMKNKTVV